MTTFEKILKILNSVGAVLFILCSFILLAGYVFPELRANILAYGALAGAFLLFTMIVAKHGIGNTEITMDSPRKR